MTETQAIVQSDFNLTALSDVGLPESYQEAFKALEALGGTVEHAADVLADEWPLVEKESLVNVPFILMQWAISNPETSENGQYLVARGMTKEGARFRISDGGTGIKDQLISLTQRRMRDGHAAPNTGLLCAKGLRVSRYDTKDAAGKTIKAETFYINNQD
jgi:hypothetical protein